MQPPKEITYGQNEQNRAQSASEEVEIQKNKQANKKNGSCGTSKVSNAATPKPVLGQTQLMLQADGRQACLLS